MRTHTGEPHTSETRRAKALALDMQQSTAQQSTAQQSTARTQVAFSYRVADGAVLVAEAAGNPSEFVAPLTAAVGALASHRLSPGKFGSRLLHFVGAAGHG